MALGPEDYLIGEQGPELFVPTIDGTIVRNQPPAEMPDDEDES
jgi:hypothetical protein